MLLIRSANGQVAYSGENPKTIDFSADSGNIVDNITWSSWGADQAVGHGTWTYQSCVPNCAQGTTMSYPATITLSKPAIGAFTELQEVTSGPQGFTQADHLGTVMWPLSAS